MYEDPPSDSTLSLLQAPPNEGKKGGAVSGGTWAARIVVQLLDLPTLSGILYTAYFIYIYIYIYILKGFAPAAGPFLLAEWRLAHRLASW